jgi:AcrR family transcriptional regulator
MPKIWADTIADHRRQVTDAIVDATAQLIAERGLRSVAMSAIAERAGIGRATLYKYFPDVESILLTWYTRAVAEHRRSLAALAETEDVTLDDVGELLYAHRRSRLQLTHVELLALLGGDAARSPTGSSHELAQTAQAVEREIVEALAAVLERLILRQEVRDDHDPALLARWLLHAAHASSALDDQAVADLAVGSVARHRSGRRGRICDRG